MRSEEEPRLSFHDQQNLEQRWYLFLSLAALRAEATNGAFLPVEFRISLWLVLLETLGTFGLQLVGQVMEDAHTVFHRLMETKESNNNIIFLGYSANNYFNWSEQMVICNIRPTYLTVFAFQPAGNHGINILLGLRVFSMTSTPLEDIYFQSKSKT